MIEIACENASVTAVADVTSTGISWILLPGNSERRAEIAALDDVSVLGRSNRHIEVSPCSKSALAAARPRPPAPPVSTALPSVAKRAFARFTELSDESRTIGAVSGLLAVDKTIVGTRRDVRASLASWSFCGDAVLLDVIEMDE